MTVPPLFLKRIKWFFLFFLLTTSLTFFLIKYRFFNEVLTSIDCTAAVESYVIHSDGTTILASGEYHFFTDNDNYAKKSYIGHIIYYDAQGKVLKVSPVNRETDARINLDGNRLMSDLTAVNRRFGDLSSDEQIKTYIFSNYSVGNAISNYLYWLEGNHLSVGPEHVPRVICQSI